VFTSNGMGWEIVRTAGYLADSVKMGAHGEAGWMSCLASECAVLVFTSEVGTGVTLAVDSPRNPGVLRSATLLRHHNREQTAAASRSHPSG
jgi:hypothetical protein